MALNTLNASFPWIVISSTLPARFSRHCCNTENAPLKATVCFWNERGQVNKEWTKVHQRPLSYVVLRIQGQRTRESHLVPCSHIKFPKFPKHASFLSFHSPMKTWNNNVTWRCFSPVLCPATAQVLFVWSCLSTAMPHLTSFNSSTCREQLSIPLNINSLFQQWCQLTWVRTLVASSV